MYDALYIGATGMRSQQTQIDAIAQNVANLSTNGYRRSVVSFADVMASIAGSTATQSTQSTLAPPQARSLGAGDTATVTVSNVAGALNQTNSPFNVALNGAGFFEVMRSDGTPAYTRDGELIVNTDGLLAFSDGSPLAGKIAVPSDANNLQITADGHVSAFVGGNTVATDLGQIELVQFPNTAGLAPIGNNLYVPTPAAGNAQPGKAAQNGFGSLQQGFLESSNVQMSDEMVNLMLAQRGFEMNSKIIQAADQMLGITNGLSR
jgi:flagellar basal-body rod protein FlgG